MSVGWSSRGKPLKLGHYDISRAHFQGTSQRHVYVRLPAEDRQKYGEDKVGKLMKGMYGTQELDLWNTGIPKRQTQCSIVPQCKSGCEDGSAR